MKLLKVVLVVALVFSFSPVAFSETQSVKVSGDITMRAFMRDNYDLNSRDRRMNFGDGGVLPAGQVRSDASSNTQTFLMSTAEVQIDAELTDNVSGVIRLVNQRAWGDQWYSTGNNDPELNILDNSNINAFNVAADLAYIELREFLYSPLTLRIGRQDLWFGRGFIIGNSLMDPQGNLPAPEYTAINSFDAIRGTLDFYPWTIDLVFAKMHEGALRADDDINLWGVNVGYIFDEYNAEMEGYYWLKQDRNPGSGTMSGIAETFPVVQTSFDSRNGYVRNDVSTFGLRGSFDPIEDWTVALEGAMQFGNFIVNNQQARRSRYAYAIDAMVETRIFQDDYAWRPVLSAEYILYSGQSDLGNLTNQSTGSFGGWDPMYRGKVDTHIREFQGTYYIPTQDITAGNTNQHQVLFRANMEPMDSVRVETTYALFWLYAPIARDQAFANTNKNHFVGQEVNVDVLWDYTEDVQFGLLSAWFMPGSAFSSDVQGTGKRATATSMVGTVKLSF